MYPRKAEYSIDQYRNDGETLKFNSQNAQTGGAEYDDRCQSALAYPCPRHACVRTTMDYLHRAADGTVWQTVEDFESDVLVHDTQVDSALVRCCRLLTSQYIRENPSKLTNGISIHDTIMPFVSGDISSLEQYCYDCVEKDGIDAEGTLVDLGILPSILNFRSYLCLIDRESVAMTIHSTHPDKNDPLSHGSVMGSVHVLLQPGHFDILYPKSEEDVVRYVDSRF